MRDEWPDDQAHLEHVRDALLGQTTSFPPAPAAPTAAQLRRPQARSEFLYHRVRVVGWSIIAGYVLILAASQIPAFGNQTLLGPGSLIVLDNVLECFFPLVAAALFLRRHRDSRLRPTPGAGPASSAWLGASCLSWGAGQLYWTWREMVGAHDAPFPSLSDMGFLPTVPLAIAGVLLLPTGPHSFGGRAKTLIDGLVVASAFFGVAWQFYLRHLVEHDGDQGGYLSITYPVLDLLLAAVVLAAVANRRHSEVPQFRLLAGAILALSFSDTVFAAHWLVDQNVAAASLFDTGWMMCFMLLAQVAICPDQKPHVWQHRRRVKRHVLPRSTTPYLVASLLLLVIGIEAIRTDEVDAVTAVTAGTVLLLATVRHAFAAIEAERLASLSRITKQISSDLDVIRNFAGHVILQAEQSDVTLRDEFLDAVHRMSKQRELLLSGSSRSRKAHLADAGPDGSSSPDG